jgi:hypothetical protein
MDTVGLAKAGIDLSVLFLATGVVDKHRAAARLPVAAAMQLLVSNDDGSGVILSERHGLHEKSGGENNDAINCLTSMH